MIPLKDDLTVIEWLVIGVCSIGVAILGFEIYDMLICLFTK